MNPIFFLHIELNERKVRGMKWVYFRNLVYCRSWLYCIRDNTHTKNHFYVANLYKCLAGSDKKKERQRKRVESGRQRERKEKKEENVCNLKLIGFSKPYPNFTNRYDSLHYRCCSA